MRATPRRFWDAYRTVERAGRRPLCLVGVIGLVAMGPVALLTAQSPPQPVRSRHVELHYRLSGAGPSACLELWYTRDRGASWEKADLQGRVRPPIVFRAPGEGLYGLIAVVRDGDRTSRSAPQPGDSPEQWVFIDETPPLLQWGPVEPDEDFARRRMLRLSWTAHDDHFDARPISLAYQTSVEQTWVPIEESLPNTGRYDWKVPADLCGRLTLRVTARDMGGHIVDRLLGPLAVESWVERCPATRPAEPATRPADDLAAASRPADPDPAVLRVARELHERGSWHMARGQYALAADRFREALEKAPDMLPALTDLAGIYYLQKDYTTALRLYTRALAVDGRSPAALRGAALAHVARKEYAQSRQMLERLLGFRPGDAEARLDLGDVLFMMGDTLGAREAWIRVRDSAEAAPALVLKARRRLDTYAENPPAAAPDGTVEGK